MYFLRRLVLWHRYDYICFFQLYLLLLLRLIFQPGMNQEIYLLSVLMVANKHDFIFNIWALREVGSLFCRLLELRTAKEGRACPQWSTADNHGGGLLSLGLWLVDFFIVLFNISHTTSLAGQSTYLSYFMLFLSFVAAGCIWYEKSSFAVGRLGKTWSTRTGSGIITFERSRLSNFFHGNLDHNFGSCCCFFSIIKTSTFEHARQPIYGF